MRPIWSGAITFGLINIPIQLYSGSFERGINLDMLHKKDLSPIRFARICKEEEKEVPYDEIVKGYALENGEYVILSDEDFVKANPKKTKTIEIASFIDESEVDPIFYDKPFFLEPGKGAGAAKTYLLLSEALKKSKKVGVATYVVHTKAHLGLIKPHGRGLILEQLRFHSDVRNFAEIELPVAKILPKELDIAMQLIDQLTEPFHPEKFKDTYTEELEALIHARAKGKKIHKVKEPSFKKTETADLMDQLKESLKHTRAPSKTRAPRRTRATRVKK